MPEKTPMSPAGQKQAVQRRTVRKPEIHKPTVDHSKAPEKLDQSQSISSKPAVPALTHIEPDALNLALLKAQLQLRASSQNVKQPQPGKSLLILVGGI